MRETREAANHAANRLVHCHPLQREGPRAQGCPARTDARASSVPGCCSSFAPQHLLRTVPPSQSAAYAEAHDHAVWGTLQALLGERGAAWPEARRLAFLPAREGGLGLLCATRAAPAAYWAALPVMLQRRPDAAERCVRELLVDDEAAAPCLREAAVAGDLLRRHKSGSCGSSASKPCSCSRRSLAHAATPSGAPTGVPRATNPRSGNGLSPRHASGPSSEMPGGAAPPAQL